MNRLFSDYQFTLYSWTLFATTGIALVIAVILWRRRAALGARYLALLELTAAEWAFAIAFEAAATEIPLKLLWSKIAYLGTAGGPLLFFLFAIEYSQQCKGLSPRNLVLLSLVPAATLVVAATNDWHHWLWTDVTLSQDHNIAIYGHGAWFWLFVAYTYGLLSWGTLALYRALFRFPAFYHRQTVALLIGTALPLVGNVIYVSGLNPIPGVDWTPITFALTGIVLAWGILKLQVFDLTPIARNRLVESMVDGILVLDARNRIVDINLSAQRLLADDDGSFIGEPIEKVLPAWPDILGHSRDDAASTEVVLGETEPRTLDVRRSPLHDCRGHLLGHLIVLRDITERKRVEGALRKLNATLEEQVASRTAEIRAEKEKVETILRSTGDAIMLTDLEMRIQYVNQAFTALTGYTAQEVWGRHASSVGAATVSEEDHQYVKNLLVAGKMWQGEAKGHRKDGRTYDAALIITPVRDPEGQIVGYVSSHHDVSRHRELERARRRFMTSVSHELRTPVANIKLYAKLLRTGRRPEKTEHYLQVLQGQAERLENLIQDVLEITELDSGRAVTVWEPVSLSAVVREVVARYASHAEAAGLTLTLQPAPPDLPGVKGDQARLIQALGELVKNACVFTPDGGQVTVETQVVTAQGKRWVTLVVQDTGPGIPVEEQEQIFDRFYRGSQAESGNIPGTGLGLSMAKEILQAHGGRATVESEVGSGSTFRLWLPVSAD